MTDDPTILDTPDDPAEDDDEGTDALPSEDEFEEDA